MTVRVYVPREPEVENLTVPDEPVVPLAVRVAPFGRFQRAATVAPEMALPLPSLTVTVPLMLAVLPRTEPLIAMLVTRSTAPADPTLTEISARDQFPSASFAVACTW